MDCQMPELDGYQTTQCIRSGESGEQYVEIPIIAMTANAMVGDKEKCLDAGMNDYATKPVDPSILQQKLCLWLGSRGQSSGLKSTANTEININDEKAPEENKQLESQSEVLVWQRDAFFNRIRNNEKMGRSLIELFLEDAPLLKNTMDNSLEDSDFDTLLMAAHKLKGSTKNLGGEKLALTIEEIEQMVKEDKIVELAQVKQQLEYDFEQLCKKLTDVEFST